VARKNKKGAEKTRGVTVVLQKDGEGGVERPLGCKVGGTDEHGDQGRGAGKRQNKKK